MGLIKLNHGTMNRSFKSTTLSEAYIQEVYVMLTYVQILHIKYLHYLPQDILHYLTYFFAFSYCLLFSDGGVNISSTLNEVI